MSDVEAIKSKLFNAWDSYHSFAVNKSQLISSLDSQTKELLEIALIQEQLLPIQAGLHTSSIKSFFQDYAMDSEPKKVIWLCDLFIKVDGSISEDKEEYAFYLLFKEHCQSGGINERDLIDKYLKRVSQLPFYPVYDEIFKRDISASQEFNTSKMERNDLPPENNLSGFPKMWFHLGSIGKTLLSAILLLILFGVITSLSKIATYLIR